MGIGWMETESWSDDGREILRGRREDPSWGEVERAIERLDGSQFVSVSLVRRESVALMAIAGRHYGRYYVRVTDDAERWHSVIDAAGSEETVVLPIGNGQDAYAEQRELVPREWAIRAAKAYYRSGVREPSLEWLAE